MFWSFLLRIICEPWNECFEISLLEGLKVEVFSVRHFGAFQDISIYTGSQMPTRVASARGPTHSTGPAWKLVQVKRGFSEHNVDVIKTIGPRIVHS